MSELKKVNLPSGAIAYIKPELTAGEWDDVQEILMEGMDLNSAIKTESGDQVLPPKMNIYPKIITKWKYKLISTAVDSIEIDGKKISTIDEKFIRGMSISDVDFLRAECDKFGKPAITEEVKKN